MPLAHVICDANKSRAMVGFLTTDNFAPGMIPEPDTWFKPADFGDDEARQQQANDLDGQDIASIFIRFADIALHILHSVPMFIHLGTLCTAQTRKNFCRSHVSD